MTELSPKQKQLIFRSEHRGTKEMDLLLGSFAKKYVPDFDISQLALYEDALSESDPDLYNWMTGREEIPANKRNEVLDLIEGHQFKTGQ